MIAFLGDTIPGYPAYNPINKSRYLIELLNSCDLVVANLEGPLTTAPSVKNWGSSLYSHPTSVKELLDLKIDLANLANNHIFDCGGAGLEETLNVLKKNGISWMGAGADINAASQHFLFEKWNKKIAFLGFSFSSSEFQFIATKNDPGANPLIIEEAKSQIASLREKGYIVCTSFHGGKEFFRIPCPKYRAILKALAQAGSHLVVGHHAHVFQGIELFDSSIIAYGLGNFFMNTRFQEEHIGTDVGLVLTVEVDRAGPYAYSIHFVHNQRPLRKLSTVEGQKKTELIALFNSISDSLVDPVQYVREWRRDCCRMALGMNDINYSPSLLRLTRRAYGICKMVSKAFIRRRKEEKNPIQLKAAKSGSSIPEMIHAAVMGMPTKISDFRSLGYCYKAYDMDN
jgi:hypothetical protein